MKLVQPFCHAWRRRASVFLFSLITVLVASFATMAWVSYVNQSVRTASRDRARVQAFQAAEAGIEQVIHWFNHPGFFGDDSSYTGTVPDTYTEELATSPYPPPYHDPTDPFVNEHELFEPYITGVRKDDSGNVIRNEFGDPIPSRWTYYRNPNTLSSKVPTCQLDISDAEQLIFLDGRGHERARVTSIILINPADFATYGWTTPQPRERVICKVIATATAPELEGLVTMETILRENRFVNITSPGALLSGTAATFDGQFKIHWGEFWAKSDIPLQNNFYVKGDPVHIDTTKEDPWLKVRTEGYLRDSAGVEYANGYAEKGFSATPITDPNDPNYYRPYTELYNGPGRERFRDYTNLEQHQNLEFPHYDYHDLKDTFMSSGLLYFYTGTDGKIYGVERDPTSASYGQIVGKTFAGWFNTSPSSSSYWDVHEMLAFIDTIPTDADGNPGPTTPAGVPIINETYYPREPYAGGINNLATISESGNFHSRGAMFIAAHIDFGGQGNAGAVSSSNITDANGNLYVTKPDGSRPQGNGFNVAHNGFMYNWGEVRNVGNRTVYGSLYTEGGFKGSGTREIYYNYRLKDGSWLEYNPSLVVRSAWSVRGGGPPALVAAAFAEEAL